MKWKLCLYSILFFMAGMAVVASPAYSQKNELKGTFVLDSEKSDDIDEAINSAVSNMNFILRTLARKRLQQTNNPHQTIRLNIDSAELELITDDQDSVRCPLNSEPVKWERWDEEIFDITALWDGNVLKQSFQASDGCRVNEYHQDPDENKLIMYVTVTSQHLKKPFKYRLVYQKVTEEKEYTENSIPLFLATE